MFKSSSSVLQRPRGPGLAVGEEWLGLVDKPNERRISQDDISGFHLDDRHGMHPRTCFVLFVVYRPAMEMAEALDLFTV